MKSNFRDRQKDALNYQIALNTIKPSLDVLMEADGFRKKRLLRFIEAWKQLHADVQNDPNLMFEIDYALEQKIGEGYMDFIGFQPLDNKSKKKIEEKSMELVRAYLKISLEVLSEEYSFGRDRLQRHLYEWCESCSKLYVDKSGRHEKESNERIKSEIGNALSDLGKFAKF